MIPTSFEYKKANSVSEAIQLMQAHGDDAKILAGGHSLIPTLKLRLNNPGVVIDISKIAALGSISSSDGTLTIGANCTHGQIADSDEVRNHMSMIADAAGHIGDVQVRNAGTIGGSIAHADPAADWPTVLIAADASIHIHGPAGERSVAAEDFFEGLYTTSLADHELVTSVSIPDASGTTSAYEKFVQPASRFAIVGCAVVIKASDGNIASARVALGGVSESAGRDGAVESALVGQSASSSTAEAASAHAAETGSIMSDHFADEEYRKQMAKVYTKRALLSALA